ncbi:hypothetical protein A3J20_01520 [Candidatus Gottesmanbacteria bacterium RIFCSPLOWO2_02_FULL_42_29]|uniref:Uncharacterized protein n=2 Tax=Candidatus Gottesmaniibacteriota TaxID=1752720 RepID=A0A1F6BET8_9BACT|nr:MAG: hypothetical protein UV09_C0021G0006 [Candidatus Gottesmanbacteria bacterium GW2011_GWA2_42_18]OGG12084.1 MAG: hypothetical protein A2781_03380 [Candidatus Gottesmanbacteria bacterium RIFCSPHIGHO2_01_FULL_42_27]OGG34090.1 MAG: hypothetical protein A3G68_01145 [Candidatus Gottesmanbacteria bacterium RIFCSPLOWO2_12_FULL_42_10]OGG35469.1 MAG: hypothetical protein A2968_00735 [Candidatus Gottesmanbacteria bacterium RIFCSPLOWO2_01_FULL_42_22]OGG38763.1 MAG: hypothetical protein A3J20_01520 [
MFKLKINKSIVKFFRSVFIAMILTRIWVISLTVIFDKESKIYQRILNDSLHHYQIGLLLILYYLLNKKRRMVYRLPAIGLGIIFEEFAVVLGDLGFNTTRYYLKGYDFLITGIFVILFYIFILRLHILKRLVKSAE